MAVDSGGASIALRILLVYNATFDFSEVKRINRKLDDE